MSIPEGTDPPAQTHHSGPVTIAGQTIPYEDIQSFGITCEDRCRIDLRTNSGKVYTEQCADSAAAYARMARMADEHDGRAF